MKGFFVSIVTLVLVFSLAAFSMQFYSGQAELDGQMVEGLPAETAGYAFDDIGSDVDALTGINFALARNSTTLNASFGGTIGMQRNLSQELTRYGTYADSYYSQWTGANATLGLSTITDGSVEVMLSNGLQYVLENGSAVFESTAADGATNVTRYEISVNVDKFRYSEAPWVPSGGDVVVVLRYVDRNGSIAQSGSFSSTGLNNYVIAYSPLESLTISMGAAGARKGVLTISRSTNVTAVLRINASISYANESEVRSYYGVSLNYSQAGIERDSLIEGKKV
ncbi:Uncharacterised protein [uncultured archaeon]|nr:Uncharacterised protein [uncultured archaeon]